LAERFVAQIVPLFHLRGSVGASEIVSLTYAAANADSICAIGRAVC